MVKFLKWRALYKLGGLPDACQGLGDKRAGLLGRWRLIPPALDRFGHDRMAGGVIGLRYALSGMGVGDCGAGLRRETSNYQDFGFRASFVRIKPFAEFPRSRPFSLRVIARLSKLARPWRLQCVEAAVC